MPDSHISTAPKPHIDAEYVGADDHKSARRGAIFIGVALLAFLVYLVVSGQVAQFLAALVTVQIPWLLVSCLCMLLYLVLGIVAYAIAVWLDPASPVGIRDLISVEASGIFFGNLTPMMMGSTPAQIYRLTKAGQNVGEAGATQFTRFIVYQFGLVVWGSIMLAARLSFFLELYSDVSALIVLCIFSFGGHVCILLGIFAIALLPGPVSRIAHWIISLLARLGFAREKTQKWHTFVDEEVYSFSDKFKRSASHMKSMALTVVITMLQLAFFYLVPYFLMLAFGHYDIDFLSVMAASAFVQLLSSAVPLPGGTGGAEGGFALFLGHFFGSAATAGYLLWRLITFIIPTIVAAPLLGLKSAHNASIHKRWNRFREKWGIARRTPRKAETSSVALTDASPSSDIRVPLAQSATHRTSHPPRVRQTSAGITVSPKALGKQHKA